MKVAPRPDSRLEPALAVSELPEAISVAYDEAMYWRGLYEEDLAAGRNRSARRASARMIKATNRHAALRKQLMGEEER